MPLKTRFALVLAGVFLFLSSEASPPGPATAAPGPLGSKAQVPVRFWGVVAGDALTPSQARRVRRGRVDTIRAPLYWSGVQPSPGRFDWAAFDRVVSAAARRRIEVLPFLYSTPGWISADERLLPVNTQRQRRAWSSFVRAAAGRYGPGGAFWRSRPRLPRLPIRNVQIWNEQNYFYFARPVSPRRYARLVKLSSRALRQVNPRLKLILGGVFGWPAAKPPKAIRGSVFLERMYRVRGVKKSFDAVALHPYSPSARYVRPQVREIRRVMQRNGHRRRGLWITEITWASSPRGTPFGKGRRGQARELGRAFTVLRRNQRRWRLKRVFWFSLLDTSGPNACSFCDASGLFTARFRAKPAWHRYVKFSGGRP